MIKLIAAPGKDRDSTLLRTWPETLGIVCHDQSRQDNQVSTCTGVFLTRAHGMFLPRAQKVEVCRAVYPQDKKSKLATCI